MGYEHTHIIPSGWIQSVCATQ